MGPPLPSRLPRADEWLRRLGSLPLMAQPGERWMYNASSDVLGVLVARVSGRWLGAFMRMMLNKGLHGREQVLSRASVELMTSDQLAPQQREGAELFFGAHGSWVFGRSPTGRCCDVADFRCKAAGLASEAVPGGEQAHERPLSRGS